jgi:Zn-dependent peptidase ImmA (M78 family)/transcriptional regulator with XRE-family HTH domain
MSESSVELAGRLADARTRAGFSQEEVAALLHVQRPIVSYWETGERTPNSRQLSQLASIYRLELEHLVGDSEPPVRPDFQALMFRDAAELLDAHGKYEIQRFFGFLDAYGAFLEALGEPPGLRQSPLSIGAGFSSREDVRRKAEEARVRLRLGSGPIPDLSGVMDAAGITVYRGRLGADLESTVSGAFVNHDAVGFAVLVNSQTTPGRRRFTMAHELAHALFHGDGMTVSVSFRGRREALERFANAFAAEFLVPITALRSAVEAFGASKVTDAETVVHLQRLFDVSYAMMLVRLRAANLLTPADDERLRRVQPVHLAQRRGYATDADEWEQDPERWGLASFPRRFLRLLRRALDEGLITVSGAAEMTGLALDDIEEFASDSELPADLRAELEYFDAAS